MKEKKQKIIKKEKNKNKQIRKDKRLKEIQHDPKFTPLNSKVTKVKIDDRFSKMLTDPRFKISTTVDKYGRNTHQEENQELLDYYYQDQKEVPSNQQELQIQENQDLSESIQEQKRISKWMQQYNEESSMDEEMENLGYDELMQEQQNSLWSQEKVIKNENVKVTKRLALCNYDWMNISAKDLMLLFSSFKPNTGSIQKIAVYYSDFGKQKMNNQEINGPQNIWEEQKEIQKKKHEEKSNKKSWKEALLEIDKGEEGTFNEVKLRQYEKQRLKYCYAVLTCDSQKTADQIYKQCDGNQFQSSNLQFDLRFIPDDLKFEKGNLKEVCTQLPISGEVKTFINRATGHSKVKLTWEDPQLTRIAELKKKNWNNMTEEQLGKVDWGLYLDEEEEQQNENYEKLFKKDKGKKKDKIAEKQVEVDTGNGWRGECNKKKRKENDDIQITFESGFGKKKGNQAQAQKLSLKKQLKSKKERREHNQKEKHQKKEIERSKLDILVEKNKKEEFSYNSSDNRFKAVFENPAYALDPLNPQFDHRKTGEVFAEVVKRNRNKNQ